VVIRGQRSSTVDGSQSLRADRDKCTMKRRNGENRDKARYVDKIVFELTGRACGIRLIHHKARQEREEDRGNESIPVCPQKDADRRRWDGSKSLTVDDDRFNAKGRNGEKHEEIKPWK
jgi:hypothetical protein